MLLYTCTCFRFSEVMDKMFLTVRGAMPGSFRTTLGVASVFVHVVGSLEMSSTTTTTTSDFSSVLFKIIYISPVASSTSDN